MRPSLMKTAVAVCVIVIGLLVFWYNQRQCKPRDITVALVPDAPSYRLGDTVSLAIVVTSSRECRLRCCVEALDRHVLLGFIGAGESAVFRATEGPGCSSTTLGKGQQFTMTLNGRIDTSGGGIALVSDALEHPWRLGFGDNRLFCRFHRNGDDWEGYEILPRSEATLRIDSSLVPQPPNQPAGTDG